MQGYITLACGLQKYVDMTVNLGLSIKLMDPGRKSCLVHDENVRMPPYIGKIFDVVVLMKSDERYVGVMNKIRLHEVTPFEETMYVDADCLIVKRDMDSHWAEYAPFYFNTAGAPRKSGKWNNLDIGNVCETLGIEYVVQFNSGVFYWKKNQEADAFFRRVHELYFSHRDLLSYLHQGRKGQYADEPFFGTAMGQFKIRPLQGGNSLMVSTWRARRCEFDLGSGHSSLEKPASFYFGIPFVAKRWIRHSPTIPHFIGLEPRSEYDRLARELRAFGAAKLSIGDMQVAGAT